jgi:hypothetical protein
MTNNPATAMIFQRIVAPLVVAAVCMTLMPSARAAPTVSLVEQFAAQAVSVSGSERAGRIDIYIEQWSSDPELERLREPLQRGDIVKLLSLLQQHRRRVGVILMPGVQLHGGRSRTRTPRNLLFARAVTTPAGRQVIAIADEHLGLGEPPLEARKSRSEFNLLDIRFGPDGNGIGKVVSAESVAFNPRTGMLEVKDYTTHPARLVDVRTEKP